MSDNLSIHSVHGATLWIKITSALLAAIVALGVYVWSGVTEQVQRDNVRITDLEKWRIEATERYQQTLYEYRREKAEAIRILRQLQDVAELLNQTIGKMNERQKKR